MNTPPSNDDEASRKAKALMDTLDAREESDSSSRKSWMGREPGGPNLLVVLSPLWAWVLVMLYLKPSGAFAFFTHALLGGAFIVLALWSWKGSLGGLGGFGRDERKKYSSPEELHDEVRRAKERRERYEAMRARHEKVSQRKQSK